MQFVSICACMCIQPIRYIYSGEYLLTTAWTKDLGPSVASALTTLAEGFDGEKFDWQCVRKYNLVNHCVLSRAGPLPTCGKILEHAVSKITAFRESVGVKLCVFKVGVTSNPLTRYVMYRKQGFTMMWVITKSSSVDLIHMLEAACVSHFNMHVGCRNQRGSGGEGALNRANPTPPFFLYVTGGRADQPRRVG